MNDGSFKQDTVSVLVCYRGRYEEHVIFHRWDTRDKITKERWDENASRLGHDIMDWTDKQLKEHHEYAKAVKARKSTKPWRHDDLGQRVQELELALRPLLREHFEGQFEDKPQHVALWAAAHAALPRDES